MSVFNLSSIAFGGMGMHNFKTPHLSIIKYDRLYDDAINCPYLIQLPWTLPIFITSCIFASSFNDSQDKYLFNMENDSFDIFFIVVLMYAAVINSIKVIYLARA